MKASYVYQDAADVVTCTPAQDGVVIEIAGPNDDPHFDRISTCVLPPAEAARLIDYIDRILHTTTTGDGDIDAA